MKQTFRGIIAAVALAATACHGTASKNGGGGGSGGGGNGNGPPIASFTATPSMLPDGGGMVTLAWSVSGADQIVIDPGVGMVTGSSAQTTVTKTTVFTLSASNGSGTSTKSAVVTVGAGSQNPVILSFTATPANLASAGQVTLSWQVVNATSLSIDNGVGTVTGDSVTTSVSATTIFTMTAMNAQGSTQAATAVVIGQNPDRNSTNRFVAMVAPTGGESFIAPATLRLIGIGRDPLVDGTPDGHGGNASKVQFFVDDTVALEVDGASTSAEYFVFKGFANGIASGQHRVWVRGIYVNPAAVLDSPPRIITVADPPTYGRTVDLTADVTVSGSAGYELAGSAGSRIRLNGNGHRIISSGDVSGPFTLKFVDAFNLGDPANTANSGINVTSSGSITIEDSNFDNSNPLHLISNGSATASIRRNTFRSNMRMPEGQMDTPGTAQPSNPVVTIEGSSTGAKVFAGNNIGVGWVDFANVKAWTAGGDTDADSNVLIGPRVGINASGEVQLRRNYSHHVYYGGWSSGNNFNLGGSPNVVAEHNVIYNGSWPVRGVAGEVRYNLILQAGHQWIWADHNGGSIHHNVFLGGEADIGGIFTIYNPTNLRIFNNTIDGLSGITLAMLVDDGGTISLTSNLFVHIPSPTVKMNGGTLTADYNLFFTSAMNYSDGRHPAHDVTSDPQLSNLPTTTFDLDEVGVWKRTITVRDILSRYRARYLPKPGSPAIDAGDPAVGAGNDIGAVGAGEVNGTDLFGQL